MLISCKKCNTKNSVNEVLELEGIVNFTSRFLIKGECNNCKNIIAMLIEVRISDNAVFLDRFFGKNALRVISRERKRIKNKQKCSKGTFFHGWVYGINTQRHNKFGEITSISQHACDYKTGKRKLQKTIYNNENHQSSP